MGACDEVHPCHWSIRTSPLPFLLSSFLRALLPERRLLSVLRALVAIACFCFVSRSRMLAFLAISIVDITHVLVSTANDEARTVNIVFK